MNRKKSSRSALSSSIGGRKIWKNRKVGCMPSHTVRALLKWLRLKAEEASANAAPKVWGGVVGVWCCAQKGLVGEKKQR